MTPMQSSDPLDDFAQDIRDGEPEPGIPTEPEELERWKERFTADLLDHPHDDWSSVRVHVRKNEGGASPTPTP